MTAIDCDVYRRNAWGASLAKNRGLWYNMRSKRGAFPPNSRKGSTYDE